MSDNPGSGPYTLDELQRYAKKHFPKAFEAVSNPNAYTLELRKLQDLDKEQNDAHVLHVGHYSKVNGDIGLWACNIRAPIYEDTDEDTDEEDVEESIAVKTGMQNASVAGAATSSTPALDDTETNNTQNANANEERDNREGTEVRLACYQGKQDSRLKEINMDDPNALAQFRYMFPYHQIAGIKKNNTAPVRAVGRKRLSVFVEYVFMLKGESDGMDRIEGKKTLEIFKEACT